MTTAASLAQGSKIKMGDGADPQVFSAIGEVGDFEVNDSVDLVDVTNHDSGGRMEYIADVEDGDEISFPVNYSDDDATHNVATGLRGKKGQRVTFQIEAPNEANGIQFDAIVIGIGRSHPVKGAAKQMNVTLKPTGAVTSYAVA